MHILLTGANGFIGTHLTQALLNKQEPSLAALSRITVVDLNLDHLPEDPRLEKIVGSYSDPAVLQRCLQHKVDLVFHLAAVPSGLCEQKPDLGMEVNVQGMIRLLDALRAQQNRCKFVFASSIAVYGKPQTDLLTDDSLPHPTLSYGMHKIIGEVLVNDYSRRGWLDGVSLRLPGIVTRPPEPNGAVSIFFSDLIRELSAKRRVTCPVSPQAHSWLMSVGCCVENLLHAAVHEFSSRRTFMLPALWVSLEQLVQGVCTYKNDPDLAALVDWQPDAWVEFNFGSYPPLRLSLSEAEGFRPDTDLPSMVAASLCLSPIL